MIIVTGGAGFIGSALVKKLNDEGYEDIIIVDNLGNGAKWKNLLNLKFLDYVHKKSFFKRLDYLDDGKIEAIFHLGACSSTTEADADYLYKNNFIYSKRLANFAVTRNIPFIYASSAATYGAGEQGYSDGDEMSDHLRPLNKYGWSKLLMDRWVLQNKLQDKVCGLKFFNVFGPNEYHKGPMKSMVYKAFYQIQETGGVKLFKSNHPDFGDGGQQRDFIYVKDVVDVIYWLFQNPAVKGIFNVGTGIPHTWKKLMQAVFTAMNLPENITYIEMPEILQNSYQNYTCARMDKLQKAGCPLNFMNLQESVTDYVVNYLAKPFPYL
ncbi:MAG: ADP-glyceromanno-heptose 6-epimerase [Candidatus Cloacimonetes bacterium]|nr:ADP-glyceromanno-heptose 6-epimerase [Candidatus Cloacimonadota bacterium]